MKVNSVQVSGSSPIRSEAHPSEKRKKIARRPADKAAQDAEDSAQDAGVGAPTSRGVLLTSEKNLILRNSLSPRYGQHISPTWKLISNVIPSLVLKAAMSFAHKRRPSITDSGWPLY